MEPLVGSLQSAQRGGAQLLFLQQKLQKHHELLRLRVVDLFHATFFFHSTTFGEESVELFAARRLGMSSFVGEFLALEHTDGIRCGKWLHGRLKAFKKIRLHIGDHFHGNGTEYHSAQYTAEPACVLYREPLCSGGIDPKHFLSILSITSITTYTSSVPKSLAVDVPLKDPSRSAAFYSRLTAGS
ncbi:hypothetical protein EYF80_044615 [Liparis tanakae]|uniref:Uncharacterized protein n=1 Tax=Liparis tanakae TaxID=230148 RepID=A0A4Z2FWA4_9TELE|nr:hypothetical protein EYF80_044615 [Liparis tanakae]